MRHSWLWSHNLLIYYSRLWAGVSWLEASSVLLVFGEVDGPGASPTGASAAGASPAGASPAGTSPALASVRGGLSEQTTKHKPSTCSLHKMCHMTFDLWVVGKPQAYLRVATVVRYWWMLSIAASRSVWMLWRHCSRASRPRRPSCSSSRSSVSDMLDREAGGGGIEDTSRGSSCITTQ